jgi:hypothetical protein
MNILNFNSVGDYMPNIKPAKNYIPDWYKDIKGYNKNNLKIKKENNRIELNLKSCMPFFDPFNIGYIVELAQDIYVEIEDGSPKIIWRGVPDPLSAREVGENIIPIPHGYSDTHFTWKNPYILNAKKGYSAIVTHPFNRHDLPFITLTGIMDIEVLVGNGNIPFFIKKGFEGLIPRGTPILQIIPFKRESWKINKDESLIEKNNKENIDKERSMIGWYKSNRWQKKEFN